jgi:hypothetical protein
MRVSRFRKFISLLDCWQSRSSGRRETIVTKRKCSLPWQRKSANAEKPLRTITQAKAFRLLMASPLLAMARDSAGWPDPMLKFAELDANNVSPDLPVATISPAFPIWARAKAPSTAGLFIFT